MAPGTRQKSEGDGRARRGGRETKSRNAPNAVELLREDHEKVKQLFGRLEAAGTDRGAVAEQIFDELELHAQVEEQVFYPALASIGQEGADTVAVSLQEHQVMKDFMSELRRIDPSDSRYEERFEALRESVLDHATEEEETVFPMAQLHLDIYDVGATIQAMKAGGGGILQPFRATSWLRAGGAERWSHTVQDISGAIRRNPAAMLLMAASVMVLLSPGTFRLRARGR
jgi:hemerythrin superfamily protein